MFGPAARDVQFYPGKIFLTKPLVKKIELCHNSLIREKDFVVNLPAMLFLEGRAPPLRRRQAGIRKDRKIQK